MAPHLPSSLGKTRARVAKPSIDTGGRNAYADMIGIVTVSDERAPIEARTETVGCMLDNRLKGGMFKHINS